MSVYKKVLIINPFGIGDVLFTTPIIRAVKDTVPGARIGYLCSTRSSGFLKNDPLVDRVFVYDRDEFDSVRKSSILRWFKKYLNFLGQIRSERFDIALDLSLNSPYGFFCWFAGIKKRVGYDYKNRGIFLTDKIKLPGYRKRHVLEYYCDLLRYLGLEIKNKDMRLYLNDQDVSRANGLLTQAGIKAADTLIGIVPGGGGSWGKDAFLKHWPADRYAALADKVVENYPVKIIILGALSETQITAQVRKIMKQPAIDLSGKTSVGELAALLKLMKVVITNDGGPLHMANALGARTVSIFGPVDEKIYGPYPVTDKQAVVKAVLDCRPCYRDFRFTGCSFNHKCVRDITVDDVFSQLRRLM